MENSEKSAISLVRHFFSYLAIGLAVDTLCIALFLVYDLLEIHNVSTESILNLNSYLTMNLIFLYSSVFLPLGILITLFLFFVSFRYRKEREIKQFVLVKLDFLLIAWFLLLYRWFFYLQIKDLLRLTFEPHTGIALFFCFLFLLFSLLSLYFSRKSIKVSLCIFRFLLLLILVPVFISLLVTNMSLNRSFYEETSQTYNRIDQPEMKKFNVLLITLDTCRADKLSCYHFEKRTSPCIDELVQSGFIFDYAFSTSNWTKPSTASLFTSLYPGTHQTNTVLQKISPSIPTLPERFKQAGYHTAVFSGNANICADFGFHKGVDLFFETIKGTMIRFSTLSKSLKRLSPKLEKEFKKLQMQKKISPEMTDEKAIYDKFSKWLNRIGDEKFFAYLHFNTPHAAYDPPPEFDVFAKDPSIKVSRERPRRRAILSEEQQKRLLSLYYGEIFYLDSVIGKIIDDLKEMDLFNKTIIAITADHGEEFYDHKAWGHTHTMHNELLHIPLIFYVPNLPYPPSRIKSYASIIDVGPTFLSLTGLPMDPSFDGKDLSPLFRGEQIDIRDFIFAQHLRRRDDHTKYAIIKNGYKYIEYNFPGKKFEALYDLNTDFEEKKKLPLHETPEYAELKKYLQGMKKKTLEKKIDSIEIELSEDRTEELKALGYIE